MIARQGAIVFMRLISLSVLFLIVGCSRINSENYSKVQPGMTQQQVEQLLGCGKDTAQLARGASMRIDKPGADDKCIQYGGGSRYILVRYEQQKVMDKDNQGL
jgi:hypothetical protein